MEETRPSNTMVTIHQLTLHNIPPKRLEYSTGHIEVHEDYMTTHRELEMWCYLTAEEVSGSGCSYPDVALHSAHVLTWNQVYQTQD
jgi:hypothetical protein